MLQSIGAINQSRGFSFEQLEIQLAALEILLDVVERQGGAGYAAVERVRNEYAALCERYLSRITEFERPLVQARVEEIEARVSQLSH